MSQQKPEKSPDEDAREIPVEAVNDTPQDAPVIKAAQQDLPQQVEQPTSVWQKIKKFAVQPQVTKRFLPILRDSVILSLLLTGVILLLRFPEIVNDYIDHHPLITAAFIFIVLTIILGLLFWIFRKIPVEVTKELGSNAVKLDNQRPTVFPQTKDPNVYYEWATKEAQEQITWYHDSRQPKRTGSRVLRGLSIVLGALGALAPVIASIFNQQNSFIIGLGYVFLAAAGACVAGDRLFGLSSGWIRYILTQYNLESMLLDFQYDWRIQSNLGKTDEERITYVKDFHKNVKAVVANETNAWATEFQTNLSDLEAVLKTSAESKKALYEERKQVEAQQQEDIQKARRPGSIHLIVTNALDFDKVDVYMDDVLQNIQLVKISEELIPSADPGPRKVKISGINGDQHADIQKIVVVPPDSMIAAEFEIPPIAP